MTILVPITLFGWIPVVFLLFLALPPRRAVIAAFLIAWLFLPIAGYSIKGLSDYTKMSATCGGVLLATMVFDLDRLLAFRLKWVDLPMIVWCLIPMVSSLANGLGLYDGLSNVLNQTITWGLPYFIGRVYFFDLDGLRELAIGIFMGGLIYVPFCLFEIRMSPQLHNWIYGFHQPGFSQTKRFGGFRPMVFMQHGLMVGMWMCMTTLVGYCLFRAKVIKKLWGWPVSWLVLILGLTAVLCKSTGAVSLLLVGFGILFITKWLKTKVIFYVLVMIPLVYLFSRSLGGWDGRQLVSWAANVTNADRAESMGFRFENETILSEKAMQRPFLGWGGWGRNRVYNDSGRDITITDSLWIITFGKYGLIGLAAIMGVLLLPVIIFFRRTRTGEWKQPAWGGAVSLALLILLYAYDNLLNAMVNPIFILCAGGLTGLIASNMATQVNRVTAHRVHPPSYRTKRPMS